MKTIPILFFLIFVSTACASNIDLNVKSWEVLETKTFNKKIQQGYLSGLSWVTKPELYVFNLFELSNLKKVSYEYSVDNTENPENIEISIIRDGFLDDSVRGDIQQIKLKKNHEGKWEVLYAKRAINCWRNKTLVYSSEECP